MTARRSSAPDPKKTINTISDKRWDRLRDSLPFPAEPEGRSAHDLARRVKFSHQKQRSRWS